MNLQKPTIIIFDMDGTTVRHINMYLLHILEKIDDCGYTIARFLHWIYRRKAQGPIIEIDDEFLNRKKPRRLVHRAMHKVRRKPVDQIVEPCPGIYMVLDLLKKHDMPLAIVSSGLGKGYGHDILETFGLADYFRAEVFREDIIKSKPNPEPILLALKQLDIPLTENDIVWYVGDRHKDVLAALTANDHTPATIIPIAYGLHAAMAMLEKGLGPEGIIMSYYDMYMLLDRLLGKPENAEKKTAP